MTEKKTTKPKKKTTDKSTGELVATVAEVKDVGALNTSFVSVGEALQMEQLATLLYKSHMFPNVRNEAGAFAVVLLGRELNIGAMTALQNIAIIKGKFSCNAQLQQARAMKRGIKIDILDMTSEGCTVVMSKEGKKPQQFSFTMGEARNAGLVKKDSAWETYPSDMCYNRALTRGLRKFDPECVLGLYTIDEATQGQYQNLVEIPESDFQVTNTKKPITPKADPIPEAKATKPQLDSIQKMILERELTEKLFSSAQNFLSNEKWWTLKNATSLIIKLKELPLKEGVDKTVKHLLDAMTKDEMVLKVGELGSRLFQTVDDETKYYDTLIETGHLATRDLINNNKGKLANLILSMEKDVEQVSA